MVHGQFCTTGSSGSILQRFGFKLLVRASQLKYFSSALAECYSSVGVIFQVFWLVDNKRPIDDDVTLEHKIKLSEEPRIDTKCRPSYAIITENNY